MGTLTDGRLTARIDEYEHRPTREASSGAPRAPELNQPAAVYVETRGGTGVGGSDDHAGVDIGRTWSQTPSAQTPDEFLAHVRSGRVQAGGDHGSAAKWAHAALAIAVRTLGRGGDHGAPDPAAVLRMVERVMSEGDPERIGRWDRGVDIARFSPSRRREGRFGDAARVHVLYAGRLTREKGVELLADAFLAARERDPRLHLVVAGGGPEQAALGERLGEHVSFLGWLHGDELAVAYASADLFLFCSQTDTFGQVLLEAQASGLPVVAVNAGGPAELIADGRTGMLCPPEPEALGAALVGLAASRAARERRARGAVAAVADRTWERALERLGAGWRRALAEPAAVSGRLSA